MVFLSLSSLCVIYPGGRSIRIKTKQVFFVFLLSVEALLEADPNEFDLGHFPFFSQSFFLCVIYPEGKSVRINTQKGLSQSFFFLWKLSLRQILKNFHLGHFMFFFSQSFFSLWKNFLRQILMNLIQDIFLFSLSLFFSVLSTLRESQSA